MDDPSNSARRTSAEVIAAALATGAGTALGGAPGALLGAVATPAVAAGLDSLVDRIQALRIKRGGEVYLRASREAHMRHEDFVSQILEDEQLAELAGRVFLIAQDSALEAKRIALAKILGSVAAEPNPAKIDHGLILAALISAIDAPHVRFMVAIEGAESRPADAGDEGDYGMRLSVVVEKDASLSDLGISLLWTLIGQGVVEDVTGGMTFLQSSREYALTRVGRELLSLLRASPARS